MLTPEAIRKKLEHLQPTQESIETVSLWCLHHKESASMIVSTWLQIFKNAGSEKQRLSLFYLAKDVCQKGKKRKGHEYMTVFVPALKEALLLARMDTLRQNIERVLNIWEERGVFDAAALKDFRSILETSNNSSGSIPSAVTSVVETQPSTNWAVDEKIITDFNLSTLISEVEKHQKYVESIDRLRAVLPSTSLTCDGNAKSMLKSRQEGQRHYEDVNQSYRKWTEFVEECERRLKRHHHLIIALERAQIFYETQLNEAGIVQTAYEKFGNGVKAVREKLAKMRNSGDYTYVASPIADAPSPSPYDDPFAEGLEAVVAGKKDSDKLEAVDMDLDDDVKFSALSDHSRSVVTHETAIGGMKLETNQSFFNNPPSAVASNGGSFDISSTPPKKAKLDPRQQKHLQLAAPSAGANAPVAVISTSSWPSAVSPTLPPPQMVTNTYHQHHHPSSSAAFVSNMPPLPPPSASSPVGVPPVPLLGFHTHPHPQQQQHAPYGVPQAAPPPMPSPGPGLVAGSMDGGGAVFDYGHGMAPTTTVVSPPPIPIPIMAAGPAKRGGSNANNLTVLSTGQSPENQHQQHVLPKRTLMPPDNAGHFLDHHYHHASPPVKQQPPSIMDAQYFDPRNVAGGGPRFPADPRHYLSRGRGGGQHGVGRY